MFGIVEPEDQDSILFLYGEKEGNAHKRDSQEKVKSTKGLNRNCH